MRRLLTIFGLVFLSSTLLPALSAAQVRPEVSDARQQALEGNFDRAQTALDGALGRTDLTRADLLAIYEARVFIRFANSETAEMRSDLTRIAALDPNHSFDANYFPSDVTDVFREIVAERAGELALDAEAVVLASGEFEVRANVQNDPGDLTEDVRVYGRGAGNDWASGSQTLRVDPDGAESGEYYAEAVGPGGAILVRRGSEVSPQSVQLAGVVGEDDGGGGGVSVWVWIGGAAVLVAIAVVIIAVAATSGGVSDDTQPSAPMVRFSM